MRIATLFSGIGSPEQAASRAYDNHSIVFACEWDKYARESYNANYDINEKHFYNDIADLDATQYENEVDVLIGGSPCQDFSLAGLRAGVDGNKGVLIYEYIRVIKEVKPPIFIYENVKGMLSDKGGITLKEFVQAFREMGYYCHYEVLNTKNYGVAQNRERIFLVGFKCDEHYHNFSFAPKIKLEKVLRDYLEVDIDEKYYLSQKMIDGFIHKDNNFQGSFSVKDVEIDVANCLDTKEGNRRTNEIISPAIDVQKIGFINQDTQASSVFARDGDIPSLCSSTHGYAQGYIHEPKLNQVGELDIKGADSVKRVYGDDGLCPTLTTMGGEIDNPKY